MYYGVTLLSTMSVSDPPQRNEDSQDVVTSVVTTTDPHSSRLLTTQPLSPHDDTAVYASMTRQTSVASDAPRSPKCQGSTRGHVGSSRVYGESTRDHEKNVLTSQQSGSPNSPPHTSCHDTTTYAPMTRQASAASDTPRSPRSHGGSIGSHKEELSTSLLRSGSSCDASGGGDVRCDVEHHVTVMMRRESMVHVASESDDDKDDDDDDNKSEYILFDPATLPSPPPPSSPSSSSAAAAVAATCGSGTEQLQQSAGSSTTMHLVRPRIHSNSVLPTHSHADFAQVSQ